MKEIELTQGYKAIIDDIDYELISNPIYSWHVFTHKKNNNVYARAYVRKGGKSKPDTRKLKVISMHRLIMDAKKGEQIDHKDGNGLNNTRNNLRKCNQSQNALNSRKTTNKNTSSKYKGVTYRKSQNTWHALIKCQGKTHHLGDYPTEELAAIAYDIEAKKIAGEFARLNFEVPPISYKEFESKYRRKLTSQYRGVYLKYRKGKWPDTNGFRYNAAINIRDSNNDKKYKWLGYFKEEIDAAKAYDEAAKIYYGKNATLNFPD